MRRKTLKTTIGTINLSEIEIMLDCIDIFIPISMVSDRLKSSIQEHIKTAKEEYQNEFLDCRGTTWSDAGVNLDYQSLHIIMERNNFQYELCFDFTDIENSQFETGFSVDVDLSDYTNELKKIVLEAILDQFF